MADILAIDFETANSSPQSACAVGLALVSGSRLVSCEHYLIRPPEPYFSNTRIHGISWPDVRDEPDFPEVWNAVWERYGSVDYLAAHNAGFDRSVLESCLAFHGCPPVAKPFINTVPLARKAFDMVSVSLNLVAEKLGVSFVHHHAGEDARVCGEIICVAARKGFAVETCVMKPKRPDSSGPSRPDPRPGFEVPIPARYINRAMNYWLVKSEPFKYSWEDFLRDGWTYWDGVRNYQARNNLKGMKKGDLVLFYHSNKGLEVVGVSEVTKEHYQDPTTEDERWVVVDLKPVRTLEAPVSLKRIKSDSELEDMPLVKQSRLSVMRIEKRHFDAIVELGEKPAD